MTTIAYFVSSHGYGHAARACAVMAKMRELKPNVHFLIVTQVPEWFFRDSLPAESFTYLKYFTDVGFVQKSPFEEDLSATLKILQRYLPFASETIDVLASSLNHNSCTQVICDISSLGILAGKKAGVPVNLVENFTWNWMYSHFVHKESGLNPYITYLQNAYAQVDLHFQTEPCTHRVQHAIHVAPVSREPKHGRDEIRESLGIPHNANAVLISTGGIRTRHTFIERLRKRDDVFFIVPHDVPEFQKQGNVIVLPHHSQFYHPDLVQASDAVICKAGYSTVAEAYHLNKAVGLVPRPMFPESPYIERFVKEKMHHFIIEPQDFQTGQWIEKPDALLALMNVAQKTKKPNGADEIAERVWR